jgi:hypothetical protein
VNAKERASTTCLVPDALVIGDMPDLGLGRQSAQHSWQR